jgi:hypothetical protein
MRTRRTTTAAAIITVPIVSSILPPVGELPPRTTR